jgi:hypothetical protein
MALDGWLEVASGAHARLQSPPDLGRVIAP